MTKKILDILPPKQPTFLKEKKLPILRKKVVARPILERKEEKKGGWKIWWFLILLILIFGVAISFRMATAEIKIWPETETQDFKTKLTLDKKLENNYFENKIIPGTLFEVEKTFSEEFSASGKTLKKAEGIIRVYNAYSVQPEAWQEGTRFVSSDGKLFKSKNKISVPGAEIKNGKIVPSYVDVLVIAAEAGADYNIGPSHFSIVAFKGTARYTKFYGESSQNMTGGGEIPQVTKEDLEKAETILTEKAQSGIKELLKSKISGEFIFLDSAVETKILEKFSSAKEGIAVEKFNFQIKAKSTTISAKKEDVENFAKAFTLTLIPQGKLLWAESLKIDYSPESVDLESGKISLFLNLSAKIYPEINLQSFKEGLIGKSLTETKIFLENQPQIIKSEIKIFPPWVKNIPEDINKIKINYPIIEG